MKREQIIHALYTQKVIGNIDLMELLEKAGYKDYSISAIIDRITDAILAIPLEVPSDEEIAKKIQLFRKNKLDGYGNMSIGRLQLGELEWSNLVLDISKWMRDEIIKRNTKK